MKIQKNSTKEDSVPKRVPNKVLKIMRIPEQLAQEAAFLEDTPKKVPIF